MTKEKKKTSPQNNMEKRLSRFCAFWRNERTQFILGLLTLLCGSFLGLAFVSFLVTGDADQARLEHLSFGELSKIGNGITNWMGMYGAYFAEVFINRWIGLPAFLYILFLLKAGLRLMKFEPLTSLPGLFIRCALWSIWFSVFFGFFFIRYYGETFLYLGGRHGYTLVTQLLKPNIGWGGTFLVILATFILLCLFLFKSTISKTRRIIGLWPQLQARRREKQRKKAMAKAAAEEAALTEKAPAIPTGNTATDPEGDSFSLSGTDSQPISDTSQTDEEPSTPHVASFPEEETPVYPVIPPGSAPETDASTFQEDRDKIPTASDPVIAPATAPAEDDFQVITTSVETVTQPVPPVEDYDPTAELSHYRFPTFDLLKQYNTDIPVDMDEQNANKEKIKKTLHDYGIEIQSICATVGPTITLFEIVPVEGTRIAKIRGLQDEIAMSIAANSGIRIIAPIPGKTAIGIEVPNREPQIVSMHSVITSRKFQENHYELPVALGKTITNEIFTFDLAKMPHLLVAGATGQGKSVGLNAILTSLLYKKHPSQLKMVLIDPKQVEFSIYSRIEKHYLAKLPDEVEPIITDVSKVVATLNSVVIEMEDRYALLKDAGLRNIKEYNAKFIHRELNPLRNIPSPGGSRNAVHHHYLPYIVVIVDEYGDLIMTAGKEIELPIARIAQKARAVGIHMIIATQRPSARIITGIIKANFPARMAFRVGQSIDSSIILDKPGAQQLIGRGDLLFSEGNNLTRVQCAFVDTPEVDKINRYIADQQSYPTAFILPEPPAGEGGDGDGSGSGEVDLNHLDPLFNEVAELVVNSGQGSTSMIQRKFSIGYNRAGRLMDQLEEAGVVGPYEGSKARAVLVGDETELRQLLTNLRR